MIDAVASNHRSAAKPVVRYRPVSGRPMAITQLPASSNYFKNPITAALNAEGFW